MRYVVAMAMALIMALSGNPASACRSAPRTVENNVKRADLIFVAHVNGTQSLVPLAGDERIRWPTYGAFAHRGNDGLPGLYDFEGYTKLLLDMPDDPIASFSLIQSLKGHAPASMLLWNDIPTCMFSGRFEPGNDYLVFARVFDGRAYAISTRSSVRLDLDEASSRLKLANTIAYLDSQTKP